MRANEHMTVNAIRILAADAIQKAKSGHPGMPLGAAAMGYAVWGHAMTHDPADPAWPNRDRFVLSAGHGSMLEYALLYLFGYGLTVDDLRSFRQLGSRAAGHPERGNTVGVETTTGPLGQGIANAVGMAMAEAHLAAIFNREGFPVVDHYTYCILGDGCMMEGLSYEACSLAGTLGLRKLIALYDDNEISIEGDTAIAFREDVPARFRAMGWNVVDVEDGADPDAVVRAIALAKCSDRPTLIDCHTVIGYGSPNQGSAKTHGEPLGEEAVALLRRKLDWPLEEPFAVPEEAFDGPCEAAALGKQAHAEWDALFARYREEWPELAAQWDAWQSGAIGHDFLNDDEFWAADKPMATRAASGLALNRIASYVPNLFGGSADLAPSNKSTVAGAGDFSADAPEGGNIHFGVREHAMAAICNGIALHGGLRPYCATFFIFSDYMKHAMRMAALMQLRVPYILTHDSIGVGEDGPTHQPIEQLSGLRAVPGMTVFRPADARETAAGWYTALTADGPVALVLTRQDLPCYEGSGRAALRGAYILSESENAAPDCILIGSGSEVAPCMEAKALLRARGIDARVVSMPSMELFEQQSEGYKESVLPAAVRARVCVEAGSPQSMYRYAGLDGRVIAMETFGTSAPYKVLFPHFGFTGEHVAQVAEELVRGKAAAEQGEQ